MTDLTGRRALVSGGTRGIGAAIARHLSQAGARVVVSARSPGGDDGAAHFIAADLSTPDGPPHLAAQALDYLGSIDILVDNAASQTLVPAGVLAMTDADWLADLNSSLLSAVRLDRAVLPAMIAAGGGAIVHIGSNAARLPRPAADSPHRKAPPVQGLVVFFAGPRLVPASRRIQPVAGVPPGWSSVRRVVRGGRCRIGVAWSAAR